MGTIKVTNYGSVNFTGWVRTTTDLIDIVEEGTIFESNNGVYLVPGRATGLNTKILDIYCSVEAAKSLDIDFESLTKTKLLVKDLYNFNIEPPSPACDGMPLHLQSSTVDGAHRSYKWYGRTRQGFHVHAWGWTPVSEPWLLQGEVVITNSVNEDPMVTHQVTGDLTLTFKEGIPVLAQVLDKNILNAGDVICDGQAKAFDFSLVMPNRMLQATSKDFDSTSLKIQKLIGALGIQKLWPVDEGIPVPSKDKLAWINAKIPDTRNALFGWNYAGVGPTPRSSNTGAQEDQFFVGGEIQDMPLAYLPRYYAALGQFRRPCHFLESNGEHLDLDAHPNLVLWDSRPHYNSNVSKDQLGKSVKLSEISTHGWWGPDEEHLLLNTLFIAARTTGSPALQQQLEHNAINWLFSKTVDKNIATSRPGAARAVGYECWAALLFWFGLENRALAYKIIERARDRINLVLLPKLSAKVNSDEVWDARSNDPRLGSGRWWMPWQQALGAYGLFKLAELLGHEEAKTFAFESANTVLIKAYHKSEASDKWMAYYSMCLDDDRKNTSDFSDFGCPLAVAVVKDGSKAESLLKYGSGKWTCPSLYSKGI